MTLEVEGVARKRAAARELSWRLPELMKVQPRLPVSRVLLDLGGDVGRPGAEQVRCLLVPELAHCPLTASKESSVPVRRAEVVTCPC